MSNNNQRNGRQPPLPLQKVPSTVALTATAVINKNVKSSEPTDPRIRNANVASSTDKQTKICRDFVWGICRKGAQCKFRHEFDIEYMKDILKFCHDFRSRTGCTRRYCKYLHSSRKEENLFLTTGQIPRALAERYAAMYTAQLNYTSSVSEYMQAPPGAAAPPPPLPAPLPPLLAPAPPVFSAPPPFNTPASQLRLFPVSQRPPALPPMFDASRPPPPFPTCTTPKKSGSIKRAGGYFEAGPSKARKAECLKVVETVCDDCMQHQYRMERKRQELQRLKQDIAYNNVIYEKKVQQFRHLQILMRASLPPELSRIVMEYVKEPSPQLSPVVSVSPVSSQSAVSDY